jgi:hypothetical protein
MLMPEFDVLADLTKCVSEQRSRYSRTALVRGRACPNGGVANHTTETI